jgi:MFS family permease
MIAPPSQSGRRPSENGRRRAQSGAESERDSAWGFGGGFGLAYAANTLLMIAVSLLFRYSDFVAVRGGTELQLGWIVGVGAVGSLAMRLYQGIGIDRFGARSIWIASLAAIFASLVLHLPIQRVDGPGIYLVRMLYQTALAGAFGASITAVTLRAPVSRMAEVIGVLGTAGFAGMVIGSQLSDVLCRETPLARWQMDRLFLVAAGLIAASLVCAMLATRGDPRPVQRRRPPILALLSRYQPGRLLLMAVVMGIGIGLPGTFLRPFAERLDIHQIGVFFTTYASTAFIVRMFTRRVPDRLGERPTILIGMAAMALSMLLYLTVSGPATLVLPALLAGVGHAFLFPAVVAGASRSFPPRYRGLATTMVLGMFDVGNLVGMPLAGSIVHFAAATSLPPYPTMFITFAVLIVACSVYYWAEPRGRQTAPSVAIPNGVASGALARTAVAANVAQGGEEEDSHRIILDGTGQDCGVT